MDGELLELVDEGGHPRGTVTRGEAHRDPRLLHRVVHVLVLDRRGRILLQRRSLSKDVAPGLWDTSVGGHAAPGESAGAAGRRELGEELGIAGVAVEPLYEWIYRGARESEYIHTFRLRHEGPFVLDFREMDEARFWSVGKIEAALGGGVFSGQFEREFDLYRRFTAGEKAGPFPPGA